jgi:pyruvate dehydrogenase E2 component (dihydrolipoamide acetyltransferase)
MAVEVVMPKFGLTMNDGILKRWLKQPGETITEGEPLFEVETEKVLNEVPSPATGVLVAFLFNEEDTVDCGVVLAVIAQEGDDIHALKTKYTAAAAPARPAASPAPAPAPSVAPETTAGTRRSITPIARKRAEELGVDLSKVTGTGPGGRVTREDVERAAASAPRTTPAPPAPRAGASTSPGGGVIALKGIRKTIADHMMQSLRESAQLTLTTEADVSAAADLRAHLGREVEFTYTDLMVHAVARTLRRHPRLNSCIADGAIRLLEQVNIGVAVALDEGLIVPVIHNADRKTLREIAAESKDLGARARQGKLRLEEVEAGTFTITNLGTYGVDAFTPIINHGQAAILGLGRIIERPAIYRGEITRRSMMTLSLTFDHRIVDGAPAAAFLQSLIETFNYGER